MIAPATSDVPFIAASLGESPLSRFLYMFSITTMALSMSIPAPKARPPKVMMLMVRPLKYIRLKVAIIETGIEMLTISVVLMRRKNT